MKRYFDALVVVPLEEEFQLVVDAFSYVENLSSSTLIRFVVSPIGTKLNLLLVNQTKMGKQANIEAVLECLNEFNFGLLVCVGIAAGISSDVAIGDVCFSKLLVDVIDNIKVVGDKKKRTEIFLSPSFFDTPTELVISINLDRLEPGTKPAYELWLDQREAIAKGLLPNEFPGKDGKSEVVTRPKVRDGLIACGAVSASAGYNAKLRSIDRKILALETESGGMFSIARARNIPALAVRGISDYADADKNEFEAATGNNARRLAASNAASFLARQLKTVRLINYLDKRRLAHSESADQLSLLPHTEEGDILNVLLKQGESIYEKLRDQASGFSLIAKGYRLPVPRIRTFHVRSGLPSAAGKESFEVRDALRDTRVITINLTPEYPDLSLAWIIAADLLTAQLDNKQMLPCVLEASNLHRPRTGIAELLDPYTSAIAREAAVQPVFIIDNFNFDSKTRIEFLTEQIEAWPEAKFIIVTRSRRNVILESDFSRTIASATAEVTDISFIEIATFVEKNFEMPGPAAEVVAVRLREIFQKYSLAAHPSYFAGIPRATLDAFAQANRRADLIELAVAGYLSFVVAEDLEPIAMSRRTREEFLGDVAYMINVEGKALTEADLVDYATQLAKKMDYPISPARFVALFISRGLLHFEGENVRFTLPFVESFVLARRLLKDVDRSIQYFSVESDFFDERTFAIYAELGPAKGVVEKILQKLDDAITELRAKAKSESVLYDANPSLARPNRVRMLQQRLRKAEQDVQNGRDQTKEKQRLLDASDRIRERTAERVAAARSSKHNQSNLWGHAPTVWSVAVSLLGAGAERLDANTKRDFITKIVVLSKLILVDWIGANLGINFVEIKKEVLSKEDLVHRVAESDSQEDKTAAIALIESLVDLLELLLLLQPVITVAQFLCDEGRDKVLVESILKTSTDGPIDELIRLLWLSDLEPSKGRYDLIRSIKDLPKRATWLRASIATHLISRVYWKQWRRPDQLALLDVANQSLKGAGLRTFVPDKDAPRRSGSE